MPTRTPTRAPATSLSRRVVIVGAGVTGLITAVRCVLEGYQVTLLDRGPIPHPASSSFDQHRAVRALDLRDPRGSREASSLHEQWTRLETLLCGTAPGAGFYRRVGVVSAWPAQEAERAPIIAAAAGIGVEVVEPQRYPHIRFPRGSRGVLEPYAGVLLADRVLSSAARWLAGRPEVRLRPWSSVDAVDTDEAAVVLADGSVERGDLVLVAGGPWSGALVDPPTVLYRQTVVFLRPPPDLRRWWDCAPSAGRIGADGRAWLMPSGDGTLLKVSTDVACREVPSPDHVEENDEIYWSQRILDSGMVTDGHRYRVTAVKHCHYAVDALSGGAHLARVGPAVWARSASGGDGFRTAPAIADQIVAALRPPRRGSHCSTGRTAS
ncbi:NAD(P)/FAD-dependent oxidoreductase [Kineosporia succinea]|uniref:Glycine/D-amino acid oxidase-like deaminating enzyme n=1 Tax=Kineosporia succinea TaxID=84632 RepID=A0ABT9P130_9ACTN|nr:FAD-dependent oxidoreductase [Kineosporia succinea]MDP9826217.1 glycine/D-amino acid oxidase-like deaminating enzyme [Kineosporia succinea]